MDFRVQVASVFVGILIWTMVAISLKRARLYPAYAALWSAIGALLVLLPLYGDLLRWLAANLFGIVGANHLIYAMLFSFLMIYLFYLTQKICELINRVERVITFLAILDTRQTAAPPTRPLGAVSPGLNSPESAIDEHSHTTQKGG